MNTNLFNKNIAVTASVNGIGYATVRFFLQEGARVLINGRNQKKLDHIKEQLIEEFGENRVFVFAGDVSEENTIHDLADYIRDIWGYVDCVVANLGSGRPISQNKMDIHEWQEMYKINLFSNIQLIAELDDCWDYEKGGSIVLLSSLAAKSRIDAPYAYAASKKSLEIFTKYLADDYAKRKIRVNCVAPGNVLFQGGRWEELIHDDEQGVRKYITDNVPFERFAKPEEIASVIVFLSSDLASFITGETIAVDGGQSRHIC